MITKYFPKPAQNCLVNALTKVIPFRFVIMWMT